MSGSRAMVELINPAALRGRGTVKRVAPVERAGAQHSSTNEAPAKARVSRLAHGQPGRSLMAEKSLLQTGPLLAAQTAGLAEAAVLPNALPFPQAAQAYRIASGEGPEPINILIDWRL